MSKLAADEVPFSTKRIPAHKHSPDTTSFVYEAADNCIHFKCVCGKEGVVAFDPLWGNVGVVGTWKGSV